MRLEYQVDLNTTAVIDSGPILDHLFTELLPHAVDAETELSGGDDEQWFLSMVDDGEPAIGYANALREGISALLQVAVDDAQSPSIERVGGYDVFTGGTWLGIPITVVMLWRHDPQEDASVVCFDDFTLYVAKDQYPELQRAAAAAKEAFEATLADDEESDDEEAEGEVTGGQEA